MKKKIILIIIIVFIVFLVGLYFLIFKNTDKIVLNKDEFVNLDYIKTPVKGEEPACWLLSIVDANNKTVGVYVNITTGNLIGAIAGI